jgi:hypothetical protein
LIEFADRADGATITFHHVFDFTVTRVHGKCLERTTRQLKHTWDLLKEATDKKNSGQTGVTTSQCSEIIRFLSNVLITLQIVGTL